MSRRNAFKHGKERTTVEAVKFEHVLALALSYQSSSSNAEEIVKEHERTQEQHKRPWCTDI